MTTTTDSPRPEVQVHPAAAARVRRMWWWPAAGAFLTAGTAALFTYLALHNPPGVVALGADNFDTDFTNDQWVTAGLLLVVPIFLVSFRSVWFGLAAALAGGLAQFWIAEVTVERYAASDWSDGLEGLAYVYALLVAALFVGVAVLGWGLGHWRRRRAASGRDCTGSAAGLAPAR